MIAEVMDFIKDKSVAIVGNAKSIFEKQSGAEIENHDVVIRFNRGFVTDKYAQGFKTDILILACELTKAEKAKFGALFTINRSKRTHCGKLTFDDKMRRDLKDLIGAQPSSGFMAIDLCRKAGASKIDLYGFDFGATQTFYHDADYKTKHDYATEARLVHLLAGQGVLTIN